MPRKQRIEFPGACYHVISRGNYRKELFQAGGAGAAFERAIFEVAERCRWQVYAYAIMSNHYHLAIRTELPNLADGMKWLQGAFATRFNRMRGERGHVFQGRYKAILVMEERPLIGLIDYIHLNPVRAGLCRVDDLEKYTLSSYFQYKKGMSQSVLQRSALLKLCGLPDSKAGMRGYALRLKMLTEQKSQSRQAMEAVYCKGWFIGSKTEKERLMEGMLVKNPDIHWDGGNYKEFELMRAEHIVRKGLRRLKLHEEDVKNSRKSAEWKIKIAKDIRHLTTAPNSWIANRLKMGHPNYVSNLISHSDEKS